MSTRVTGQRFRQRKLSTKQNLPVVRENEVEQLADDDASRHIPKVETGVEKGEEIVSCASPLWALSMNASKSQQHTMRSWAMPCIAYLVVFEIQDSNAGSRNTIYKLSSRPPRQQRKAHLEGRLLNSTFQPQKLSLVTCSMKICIQNASRSRQLTFGSHQPLRTRLAARTA